MIAADARKDLAAWTARAAKVGAAIDQLTADPALLRLKAQGRAGALTGRSAAAAVKATALADELWALYLLFDKTLLEAIGLMESANPFGAESRAEKADALLNTASICLPEDAASLQTMSLADSPDRRKVTPGELLTLMDEKFKEARDLVMAAQRGWALSDTLLERRRRIAALDEEIRALGCGRPGALSQAEAAMEEAVALIEADPLGADWVDGKVEALIVKSDRSLTQPRQEGRDAETEGIKAGARLAAIEQLVLDATTVREIRTRKVAEPPADKPIPTDDARQLRPWLETLRQAAVARRAHAALVGFVKWNETADSVEYGARLALDSDNNVLSALERLRGRSSALAVKMTSRGRSLPPDALEILAQAQSLLNSDATPLPEATRLLRLCEKMSSGQS